MESIIWENILDNDTLGKGLISKICKELGRLNTWKRKNPIKNGQRSLTDTSPRRTYRGPTDIGKYAQRH